METSLSFEGRVAIVTGAGGGLGRAYAIALAMRGAKVLVNDLGSSVAGKGQSSAASSAVAAEIRALGGEATANCDSVADDKGAQAIVGAALDAYGSVDVVINNAGTTLNRGFHEVSMDDFKAVIGVHLIGAAAVTHAAWAHMRAKGYGRIVMTTSSAGFWGLPYSAAYSAGKAGTFGLAKALAHEGEACGIKVNAVAPGAKTRMTERMFEGRGGWTWRPELVAPLVLYLSSEGCAVNGHAYAALAGNYARIEPVQGEGRRFDPRHDVSVDAIATVFDDIDNLADARPMTDGLSSDIRAMAKRC